MKISSGDNLLERIVLDRPVQPADSTPRTFGEILQKTLNASDPADPSVSSLGAGVSVQLQSALPLPGPAVVPRLEGFLDLLDDYRRQLTDPRVNLKGLDATVQTVEKSRDALSPLLEVLPEGDSLKDVLNQALVTAEIEILRFRRGDYLPA
jgi:hypothetical protein